MANMKTERALTGRKQIFTSETVITVQNVCEVVKQAFVTHRQNSSDIEYLFNYYKGKQPILQRTKKIRPEINNKIVENHAYEIVDFKKGYVFGEPVQYVQRGKCSIHESNDQEGENDNKVNLLNEMMADEDKASKDCELAEHFFICGTAFRITLPTAKDEQGIFKTYVCDPRYTFVVYSNDYKKESLLCCTYFMNADDEIEFNVYSHNSYWLLDGGKQGDTPIIKSTANNGLGMLPIVEYPANPSRLGGFETVISLIDSLNNIVSNRVDGIEQFIQSIMWFNNCDIDKEQFADLIEQGGIKTKSEPGNPANVTIINQALDQTQVQKLVDYIYQTILTIAGVPDRRASAGGNTGQALVIGQGWTMAESNARSTELVFKRAEKQFLQIIFKILQDTNDIPIELKDIVLSDIDIKFTRNKTDNLLTKTQGLINQLQAGIHPRVAIANVGLYSDPEQVYIDSKDNMAKWKVTKETVANNNKVVEPLQA